MSKKLLRLLTLARCIPHHPYKLTVSQIQAKLEEEGLHVSLRTVQRDLAEMSGMKSFDLASDERTRPHGWYFEHNGNNDFANIMPLSLAVALKTWSIQASQLLPASVLTDLNPLVDKASKVIHDSQSKLAERWFKNLHQSPHPFVGNLDIRRSTLIHDALWRGNKFSAEIQRTIKERIVWLCYDHINPFWVLNQPDGPLLLCTLSELDPKVYGIPFDHIQGVVLTNVRATQPKNFNIQQLIREQDYQDLSGQSNANRGSSGFCCNKIKVA